MIVYLGCKGGANGDEVVLWTKSVYRGTPLYDLSATPELAIEKRNEFIGDADTAYSFNLERIP